jgi:glycosyltransferase involved in cell wall biosynthesis
MKVLVAHNRYSSAQPSGENAVVDLEVEALRAAGIEVTEHLRSSDEIRSLPLAQRALLPVSPLYGLGVRGLRTLLRQERPDVLHLHNPYPLLSPWVVRTAHDEGVPVIQTVHNYRQVCANGVYFRDGHVCTECRGRLMPVPAVVHGCYRGSRTQSLIMATALTAHRSTWRAVDRYIAPSAAIAEHLEGYGIDPARITVKPNTVPDPGPPSPPGDGFVFLGRLVREKGVALLLDAWCRHPVGALGPLRIVGTGPLQPFVDAARRPDIVATGRLDREGARASIAGAGVVVVPSVWHDVQPTVILESLAAGRPVLGTAMGGIPYAVGDGGWTVPATVDALAAALPRARADAGARAGAARARYESTFHPGVVTDQLIAIYRSVV